MGVDPQGVLFRSGVFGCRTFFQIGGSCTFIWDPEQTHQDGQNTMGWSPSTVGKISERASANNLIRPGKPWGELNRQRKQASESTEWCALPYQTQHVKSMGELPKKRAGGWPVLFRRSLKWKMYLPETRPIYFKQGGFGAPTYGTSLSQTGASTSELVPRSVEIRNGYLSVGSMYSSQRFIVNPGSRTIFPRLIYLAAPFGCQKVRLSGARGRKERGGRSGLVYNKAGMRFGGRGSEEFQVSVFNWNFNISGAFPTVNFELKPLGY
ncbi:hypothetical protein B0H16DRAFT_1465860 [Mycena metata]|uniref:Uncharacterized protein n=1 Tax=Mycena metata TaxID=1033252 RepID=A0AAD7IA46_9AGAR|nr:hypothetical protein B0H16DRAFT_1465860 [Mycena metata]